MPRYKYWEYKYLFNMNMFSKDQKNFHTIKSTLQLI